VGRGESEVVRISCQTGLVTVTKTPERERKKCFQLKHDCDMVAPGVLNENKLFVCMCSSGMLVCCVLFTTSGFYLYDRVRVSL